MTYVTPELETLEIVDVIKTSGANKSELPFIPNEDLQSDN